MAKYAGFAETHGIVEAPVGAVFDFLDDQANLFAHMNKSSGMMLGSKMHIHMEDDHTRRVGSVFGFVGTVLGIPLKVDEIVTSRAPPRRKTWETTVEPTLWVIGQLLIKNAEALERLEKVDTLVVDKTGTLTEGKPAVTAIVTASGLVEETDLLRIAASLERASDHPLAQAVVRAANDRKLVLSEPSSVDSPVGRGVTGIVEGKRVLIGTAAYLSSEGVERSDALEASASDLRGKGATAVLVAVDGKIAGAVGIADPIRKTTKDALAQLRGQGISVVMMTGDNRVTAEAVARELGITEIEADVLPERKSEVVSRLRGEGRVVAMAGDGVNDAPALAAADVGIAMGGGTDVAIESAGVTLLRGDLLGIVRARRLSQVTMGNIRQNLFFAFIYNAAGVPIAAGLLYPILGLLLSPAIAAAAMALSSVSVIGNALRLRSARIA